ncbi:MAG: hypothetical protein ACKV1O_08950 [Saprospiraceae bacterium]
MKRFHFQLLFLLLFCGASQELAAQDGGKGMKMPITISVFSESVSLPNFRGFFKNPNLGVRIGTEFYYRQSSDRQTFQTLQLGYYHHNGLHQGIFASTEFGYRKFIGNFFADATIGAGYLHLISDLRRYEPNGDGYRPASQRMHKVMPTLGLGLGYRFGEMTVFSRYEMFGEIPFSNGGSPVLPHKALHLGTRFHPF